MHKTAILLIALVGPFSFLSLNAEPPKARGPPGFFRGPQTRGSPGPSGPPPYTIKPAGPSKIFGWLGSKMPKMSSFLPRFPSFPKHKTNYPPNYKALILPQPSGKYGSGPEKVQISGPNYNAIPNVVYYPPGQEYQIPTGNTVVYENHQHSSGYDTAAAGSNFVAHNQVTHPNQPGFSVVHNQVAHPSHQPGFSVVHNQVTHPSQPGVVFESGNSGISYQHVPAQKVYSPASPQFFGQQQQQPSGNMEILPSRMVSYQKEMVATGTPEYARLEGASPSVTQSSFINPAASYSNLNPNYSQAPLVPSSQGPDYHNTGYRNQNQIQQSQQRIDMNYGSMFQNTQHHVAPMYDLGSMNVDSLGGTGPIYQVAASNQQSQAQPQQQGYSGVETIYQPAASGQQQFYNPSASDTMSLDSILSSFSGGQQQGGQQYPGHMQPSQEQFSDSQGAYSQQSIVTVPAPSFGVSSDSGSQGVDSQAQDLSVAESQYPGVQIKANAGGQEGVFDVIADADAPTFEGGHPFDLKKLMSMIEPGAQFGTSDVVAETEGAGSENRETFAPAPQSPDQSQDSGYTILQQGTNFNLINKFNNPTGHVTFPDDISDHNNLTNSLKLSKAAFSKTYPKSPPTVLNSDFIPNAFQTPGGNSYAPSKDKAAPPPHDLNKAPHDHLQTPHPQTPSDNDLLTLGPAISYHPVAPTHTDLPLYFQRQPISTASPNTNKSPLTPIGTENPLAVTRRFSPDSPLVVYHTRKPFISSNVNGSFSRSSESNEHPSHNYKATPSTTNKDYPLLGVIPGLIPAVNPFFDSVSSELLSLDGSSGGGDGGGYDLHTRRHSDLFTESEGDLVASDSRQVKAYAITVTPPTSLFSPKDEVTAAAPNNLSPLESTTTSPNALVIASGGNISSSQSQSPDISKETGAGRRFPVYKRKPGGMK